MGASHPHYEARENTTARFSQISSTDHQKNLTNLKDPKDPKDPKDLKDQ